MSSLTAFILIPITLCINIYDKDTISRSRIINGVSVSANKYPWMVSLRLELHHHYDTLTNSFCGASLIQLSPPVILSAAHCLDDFIFSETDNSVRIDINGTIYTVELYADINRTYPEISRDSFETLPIYGENVYIHQQFDETNVRNDIALLIFNSNYDIDIHPLPLLLSSLNFEDGTELITIGYGYIEENGAEPEMLQQTNLHYVDTETCVNMTLRYILQYNNITDATSEEIQLIKETYFQRYYEGEIVCVLGDNTDTCYGDSGGPLFRYNADDIPEIIGVVSFGIGGGCNTGLPTMYTSVAKYHDWIMKTINATEHELGMSETEKWFIVSIVFVCFFIVLMTILCFLGYMLYVKRAKTKKVSDGKGSYVQNGNEYVENITLKNTTVHTGSEQFDAIIK